MRHDGRMTCANAPIPLAPRWNELDEAVTLLVPIGSCEQHGSHLPLDTDTQIALEIAHRAAAHIDDCLVAPPITISASGEHQGFPGTLSIGNEAVTLSVIELCRSADWERVVSFSSMATAGMLTAQLPQPARCLRLRASSSRLVANGFEHRSSRRAN